MFRRITFVALLLMLAVSTSLAQVTAAPASMNFQGRLATSSGNPIPDGVHTLTFRIYDAQVDGNVKWSEQIGSILTRNGVFSAILGKTTPFTDTILNGNIWLDIQVDASTPLIPRQQFQSVAYALKANTVPDGSITAAKLAADAASLFKVSGGVLNANGNNVGIGLGGTAPTFPLAFSNTLGDKIELYGNGSANTFGFGIQVGTLQIHGDSAISDVAFGYGRSTSMTEIMRIKGNGMVGINTNNPGQALSIGGGMNIDHNGQNSGTYSNTLRFGTANVGECIGSNRTNDAIGNRYGLDFYTSYEHRMSIANGGNIGIGTRTPAYKLDVVGDINASGNVRANGVVLSSDARYKVNVKPFDNALDTLLNLRGVSYDWDRAKWTEKNFPEGRQFGFLAQELERVFPELVSTDARGYKSVNYIGVVPVLVEAVKTLKKENDNAKHTNNAIQKENAELRATLADVLKRLETLETTARK